MAIRMWVSLVAAVVFLLSPRPAEACTCTSTHLQVDYCQSNFIIKGMFVSMTSPEEQPTEELEASSDSYYLYEVEILEVLHGEPKDKDLKFKSNSASCPLVLPPSAQYAEYLISGSLNNDEVWFGYCNYVVPWSEVSDEQLIGLEGAYSKGCSCTITIDSNGVDKPSQCVEEDIGLDALEQDKVQRCVPDSENKCGWEDIPFFG